MDSTPRGLPKKLIVGCLTAVGVCLAALGGLLAHVPAFYAERAVAARAADDAEAEQLSRRMMTKASSLYASVGQPGRWETAFSDREANAWLAVDLPRNHGRLLPRGVADPHIRFGQKRISVGARVGPAILSAVAWIDLDIELRDINQLGIVLSDARLGAVPLPRGPILRELARRVESLGMVVDFRRLDGRLVLVVYIPSTYDAGAMSYWLESLVIGDGELLAAGETRRAAGTAGR
jgi:hypothetical protein